MQEVLYIEDVDQATALLKPQRIEMLKLMDHPCTCLELGKIFGETPQKINYHIKALQNAGLVEQVGERRVRGTVEGSYQAMRTGCVDETWAKEHHEYWYHDVARAELNQKPKGEGTSAPG